MYYTFHGLYALTFALDTLENGTCATLFPLHGVSEGALDLSAAQNHFKGARTLQLSDLERTPLEADQHRQYMIYTVLRRIIKTGGDYFIRYSSHLKNRSPLSSKQVSLRKDPLYPLPAMEVDESSIVGQINVLNTIYQELKVDTSHEEISKHVQLVIGDQLSVSGIRTSQQNRAGQEDGYESFESFVCIPGLFHYKMAGATGVMTVHLGSSKAGKANPTSLHWHNTVLERKPIVATSLPPFGVSRDLISDSLDARILHCLLRVSGHETLSSYSRALTTLDGTDKMFEKSWEKLLSDATQVYTRYTDIPLVHSLREERLLASPDEKKGDMVYEKSVLFMRDALVLREFSDSIKSGDSGRILNILKDLVFLYRGCGRSKYAHESLILLHNLLHVWPPELRYDFCYRYIGGLLKRLHIGTLL